MLRFSKPAREILEHRLACEEEMFTAFADGDDDFAVTRSEFSAACEQARLLVEFGGDATGLVLDVLRECAEGCTFFGSADDAVAFGEMTKGRALSYRKAAKEIAAKLGVEVTTW